MPCVEYPLSLFQPGSFSQMKICGVGKRDTRKDILIRLKSDVGLVGIVGCTFLVPSIKKLDS